MPGVLRSFRRPRSRLLVLAAILALATQSVATLLAPAAEARASQSAPAHVETGGTHRHHAHNPADCASCIALQLTPVPQTPARGNEIVTERGPIAPPPALHIAKASRFDDRNSRAPPPPSIPPPPRGSPAPHRPRIARGRAARIRAITAGGAATIQPSNASAARVHHQRYGQRGFMYAYMLVAAFALPWGASPHTHQADTARVPLARRDTAGSVLVLTREQAVDSALAHNPQLRASREQIAEARARVTEATALPDPQLDLSMDTESRLFTPGAQGTKELGLGVTIPFPTKLYLAGRVAGTDVDAASFSYTQSRQLIASQTVQSYDSLLVALRHGQNLREAKQLAVDFLQKTQARYNAGTAAGIDVIKAKVEVSRAENDLIANERDVANARAALNRLMGRLLGAGLEAADTLSVPQAIPPLEALEQRALQARPEVRSMAAARRGASAATSLAGQYWLPDISVTLSKDFAAGAVGAPYTTEIGFGIPLFFWQHHKGAVSEARHREMELAASSNDLSAQVSQEVRAAHAAASTSLRQVAYLRDELLPEAREAYRIASTSYGLGGSSALEVLDAQRTLLDVESQYTDALGAANDARAQLELAVGAPLDSTSTPREP